MTDWYILRVEIFSDFFLIGFLVKTNTRYEKFKRALKYILVKKKEKKRLYYIIISTENISDLIG